MIKTVEIPFAGHPDKICDQIVESLVDEYLRRDPKSRLNIKASGSHGMMMIGGTVDSKADFDASALVREAYKQIGFEDDIEPFVNIERPSEDLSKQMVYGGASGTCVVYGYATKETREKLPRSLVYAHAIARRLNDLRQHDSAFGFLRPDGKVQLSMDGERVVALTLLAQHVPGIDRTQLQSALLSQVIEPMFGDLDDVRLFINSAGTFHIGGFQAGAGASGRKGVSDTYGGLLPYGGGSFMGRDPLHPSRAGLYMARFVAKELVKEGVASNAFIQVTYTIGNEAPVCIEARGGRGEDLTARVKEWDFRPEAIVERFGLQKPMYRPLSIFGQFGRQDLPWE